MWRQRRSYLLLMVALTLFGCASPKIGRIEGPELPQDIPPELINKFTVKEFTAAAPVPEPSPEPVVPGKKGKKAKKPAPVPQAFVYPIRRPADREPIPIGEKLVYDITYLGMPAGSVTIVVHPYKEVNGRKAYHIEGKAVSSKVFSVFYKLEDTVETFMDFDGLFSHRFHLALNESKQSRDALELYDSEKRKTYYWNRWNHYKRGYEETKEFFDMEPFSQDSLSALYYIRALTFPPGQPVKFPVISEGKTWEAEFTHVRSERADSPWGRIESNVVKVDTRFQGVMQKRGDSFAWLTADGRNILLRLEAKVKIGSVNAYLREANF